MPTRYMVRQGDCLDSIAFQYGFFPETLWNHPSNSELKQKRTDPNVLCPGDVIVIPDKRLGGHQAETDMVHTYRRKGVPKIFSVQVKFPSGSPLEHKPYELIIDGGAPRKGDTDSEGWVRAYIPPNAREARLSIAGMNQTFDLGRLDPVDEPTGVQGRLHALRYFSGIIDGKFGEDTIKAIKAYQMHHDLPVTGEVTDEMRTFLTEETGA